jgi:hypothetical protein
MAAIQKIEDDTQKLKARPFHNRKDDRLKKKAFKSSHQNEIRDLVNFSKEFQGKLSLLG